MNAKQFATILLVGLAGAAANPSGRIRPQTHPSTFAARSYVKTLVLLRREKK